MDIRKVLMIAAASVISLAACEKDQDKPGKEEDESPVTAPKNGYAEGADISWLTEMEKDGVKFYTASGKEIECTALMKDIGFDAIRLRVWVDPAEGWCSKEDVLVKAKRAQDLGMRIMIDFHYSSSWADPSKQTPPEAWKDYTLQQMEDAVDAHTRETLTLLKDNGIDVEWVQVGNEVNSGMLWPTGKVHGSTADSFVRLTGNGYTAVKSIYPEAKVILHVSNGHDGELFKWFFNLMKVNGADYDMIGMSLYPAWWENGGWCDWKTNVDKCVININSMIATYGKPVMLCEIGMPVSEPQMSREAMQYILDRTKAIEKCHGAFCWEPQTDGKWKPSSYSSLGWNAYDKGAFSGGRPTIALDPFKDR